MRALNYISLGTASISAEHSETNFFRQVVLEALRLILSISSHQIQM